MFKMKGLIYRIKNTIEGIKAIDGFVESTKPVLLEYIPPDEFIDKLNNNKLDMKSLRKSLLLCRENLGREGHRDYKKYRLDASQKKYFRKRQFFYTITEHRITDSEIEFYELPKD